MTAAALLIEVTLIMTLALACTRLASRSRASIRHVLLASAFAVLLILPPASYVAPSVQIPVPAGVLEAIAPLDSDPVVETSLVQAPATGTAVASSAQAGSGMRM